MKSTTRNYQSEDDYWRIRPFLRDVSLLNHRHERRSTPRRKTRRDAGNGQFVWQSRACVI
jgi:hypothetical protein